MSRAAESRDLDGRHEDRVDIDQESSVGAAWAAISLCCPTDSSHGYKRKSSPAQFEVLHCRLPSNQSSASGRLRQCPEQRHRIGLMNGCSQALLAQKQQSQIGNEVWYEAH